jgi:hypothetical protein
MLQLVSCGLQQMAAKNPQTTLVWCHVDHASNLNFDILKVVSSQ